MNGDTLVPQFKKQKIQMRQNIIVIDVLGFSDEIIYTCITLNEP